MLPPGGGVPHKNLASHISKPNKNLDVNKTQVTSFSWSLDEGVSNIKKWSRKERDRMTVFIEICCEHNSELGKIKNFAIL